MRIKRVASSRSLDRIVLAAIFANAILLALTAARKKDFEVASVPGLIDLGSATPRLASRRALQRARPARF